MLSEEPQITAAEEGTLINIENLLYHLETRRKSINLNEEKKSILRLISHYAIHYDKIKFSLISDSDTLFSSFNILEDSENQNNTNNNNTTITTTDKVD